jgi:amidase
MSVQGIIARHAADVRLATRIMIEPDRRDPHCPPIPWDGPDTGGRPVVAVTTESGDYDIHPAIIGLVQLAAEQLREAGFQVIEIDPPPVLEPAMEWFRAGTTEFHNTLDTALKQHGSDTIQQIFEWYYQISERLDHDDYIRAFGDRTRLMRNWNIFLADYPLLITPFLMRPMYDWDYDTRGFNEVKDLFDSAIYSTGINYLGLPAGVIGMDMVEGRPAAVQIVGQRYREDLICDAMEAIEERNGVLAQRLWKDSD